MSYLAYFNVCCFISNFLEFRSIRFIIALRHSSFRGKLHYGRNNNYDNDRSAHKYFETQHECISILSLQVTAVPEIPRPTNENMATWLIILLSTLFVLAIFGIIGALWFYKRYQKQ